MVVLQLGDLFELSTGKHRSQAEDDLQVCRIWSSLTAYLPLTCLTTNSESQRTLSLVPPSIASILRLAMTACTQPHYWWQKNLEYRNAQWWSPPELSGQFWFQNSYCLRLHLRLGFILFKKSLCVGVLGVNLTIKFTKTCFSIIVLGSYLMSYGFNSMAHIVIHPVALNSPWYSSEGALLARQFGKVGSNASTSLKRWRE